MMVETGYCTVVVDARLVDSAQRTRLKTVVMPTRQVVLVEVDNCARMLTRLDTASPVINAGNVHTARYVTVAQFVYMYTNTNHQ